MHPRYSFFKAPASTEFYTLSLHDALPISISNIKFDKVIVWENGQNGQSATSGFLQNLARSLPPMMQILKDVGGVELPDRKSTRLNSSHTVISYAVFCLKKKNTSSIKSTVR